MDAAAAAPSTGPRVWGTGLSSTRGRWQATSTADSSLGEWDAGLDLLDRLISRAGSPGPPAMAPTGKRSRDVFHFPYI
ncbi:hypothetical protein ACU4GD_39395 [Cupriavidus basilensis]